MVRHRTFQKSSNQYRSDRRPIQSYSGLANLVFTTNKKHLLKHFQKDPVLFAYHLGDLDDFYFPHCQWAADYHERARIEEIVLIYSGLSSPTVLAFGLGERFEALLKVLVDLLPERFFCHYQKQYRYLLLEQYDEKQLGTHIKMSLKDSSKIQSLNLADNSRIIQLNDTHTSQLTEFYKTAFPDCYFDSRMLQTGKYFGLVESGEILSATGVHVDSEKYSVTALGNIATHPAHRDKGLARKVTARLLSEVVSKRDVITLNVEADNKAAIKCYANLGFVTTHEYEEGLFSRKTNL